MAQNQPRAEHVEPPTSQAHSHGSDSTSCNTIGSSGSDAEACGAEYTDACRAHKACEHDAIGYAPFLAPAIHPRRNDSSDSRNWNGARCACDPLGSPRRYSKSSRVCGSGYSSQHTYSKTGTRRRACSIDPCGDPPRPSNDETGTDSQTRCSSCGAATRCSCATNSSGLRSSCADAGTKARRSIYACCHCETRTVRTRVSCGTGSPCYTASTETFRVTKDASRCAPFSSCPGGSDRYGRSR